MLEMRRAVDYGGDVCVGIANIPKAIGESAHCVMHTASGVIGTALSLVTIGFVNKFNRTAEEGMGFSAKILPCLYLGAIRVLNADVSNDELEHETQGHFRSKCNMIFEAAYTYSKGRWVSKRLKLVASNPCTDCCSHIMKAWIAARILYAVAAVAATICRIADLIIGGFAAVLSVLYIGSKPDLNRFASANLTVFGALEDLSRGLRGVFNPQQRHLHKTNPFN